MPTRAAISLRALAISSACARLSSAHGPAISASGSRLPKRTAPTATTEWGAGSTLMVTGSSRRATMAGHGRRVNLVFRPEIPEHRRIGAATGGLLYKRSKILFFQAVWLDLRPRLPHIERQPFTTHNIAHAREPSAGERAIEPALGSGSVRIPRPGRRDRGPGRHDRPAGAGNRKPPDRARLRRGRSRRDPA